MIKQKLVLLLLSFSVILSAQNIQPDKTFQISKNMSIFNSVLREIEMFYVDTLNHEKMIKNAVDYMLQNMDPYTVYFPEDNSDDVSFMTTGEYGGIGSLITKTTDGICISDPYEGMPAQKNGLKAGDIILEIDGVSTKNMAVSEASSKLKGTPNTEISLKIKRYGINKPLTKKFLREKIQIHPISYMMMADKETGYILLDDFTDQASMELKNAVQKLIRENNMKKLIIDLRSNGGGLIDEAVKIMGYFVPKGTEIVSTRGKSVYATQTYRTPLDPIFPDIKVAVMVNSQSASASEILAGAMQDLDRGIIIGQRTFGKGLVQNIRPVSYGGQVKITTAKYYIPSGRCIQAIDYAKRNEDGSLQRIPDSLTNIFKTKHGRIVRDGGGIIPDTITKDERKINIAYYMLLQNLYFDYATIYAAQNQQIANPSAFVVTDEEFQKFIAFVKEKKFNYVPQTRKYFDELYNFAKNEDLDKEAEAEFNALKAKLDLNQDIQFNKHQTEIKEFLSLEIIKRYYYQKGMIEYSLKSDKELQTTLSLINDENYYNATLKGR
jgi:carboxyl-terminal processing protease